WPVCPRLVTLLTPRNCRRCPTVGSNDPKLPLPLVSSRSGRPSPFKSRKPRFVVSSPPLIVPLTPAPMIPRRLTEASPVTPWNALSERERPSLVRPDPAPANTWPHGCGGLPPE